MMILEKQNHLLCGLYKSDMGVVMMKDLEVEHSSVEKGGFLLRC